MSASGKITAARTDMIIRDPFFGTLALRLTPREDTTCETAWTDGRSLGYNPTFIESLNHGEVTALVAHEVMHCAMGHPWRRDGRDMKRWNQACDYAINGELTESGYTLPADGLFPDATQKGKSAEWIFARLPEPEPDGDNPGGGAGEGDGDGQGQPKPDPLGEVRDAPEGDDTDGTPAPSEDEWKQAAASAAQAAKMQGKLGAGTARAVAEALEKRVDVRSLLLRFFTERAKADYSWTRPNVRYLSQGIYLPALHSVTMGEVAVMIDTSGSVDEVSLRFARSIVEEIISEVNPSAVSVWYVDASVNRIDRFESGEPLIWQPVRGGGTDFTDFFQQVEDEGTAVCVVGISDLYATFPASAPGIPTLWLATTDRVAPFGETVPLPQ